MLKRLPALVLSASLACAGVAHAQGTAPATPPANGTATTRPSTPMPPMPMMGAMSMPDRPAGASFTPGEIATIGVGVVVGAVLFQGAMWHGMTVMGAAIGGWVGDYLYNMHSTSKTGA